MLIRFAFGLSYSRAVPAWEAYDEPGHFAYALQLASPAMSAAAIDRQANTERIQPPGYYLLLAAFIKLSNSDVSTFRFPELNPYFYYGVGGRNYAQHPQNPSPGDQRAETVLDAARIASLLLTLIGIAFSYRAARLIWPTRFWLAFAATAIWALWPQGLFSGAVITNDAPAMTCGALLTWLLLYWNQSFRRDPGRRSFLLGGLCLLAIMLGTLIKINLLIFLAPMAVIVLLTASPRLIVGLGFMGLLAAVGIVSLLQAMPLVLVPINVDGHSIVADVIDHLLHPISRTFMEHTLEYALRSSFGLFGWGNVLIPDALQSGWEIMATVALIGVLWAMFRRHSAIAIRQWLTLFAVLGATIGAALALCLYYQTIFLIPGRYLLPALTAFGILLVSGWSALPTGLVRRTAIGGSLAGLLLSGLLVPPLLIVPTYFHPPFIAIAEIKNALHSELAPGVILLGYDLDPAAHGVYKPGDNVPIVLYWSAFHPLLTDYTVHIDVLGPDGKTYGTVDTFPGGGQYATTYWAVNQPFRDEYHVPISADFPAPADAHLQLSLLPATTGQNPFRLGSVSIAPRPH